MLLQGTCTAVNLTFKVANDAHDTSSQYGDHFYETFLKSNIK